MSKLDQIEQQGYAVNHGEDVPGIAEYGVSVVDNGTVLGGCASERLSRMLPRTGMMQGRDDDDPQPTNQRVDQLLDRMTLEEKAAQLGSVNADRLLDADGTIDRNRAAKLLTHGIGHLTRIGGEGGLSPRAAAETTNELQSMLVEETRLGIPAIPHEECLSGYMGPRGTMFPQSIGLASTWSPALVEEITATIRRQLQAIGTAHALSPVLDIARDLRWGRVEETFGEDPYLVASMACSYVSGLQNAEPNEEIDGDTDTKTETTSGRGKGVSATLKHFAGHSVSEGGTNRGSVNVGPRELRETHLFPFEAAIQTAQAESVMNAYHDIDGVPCASDEWLLTDLLRGEWGFDGTVVSDYYSVEFLKSEHGVAANRQEAGVTAVESGIDVELPATDCYGDHLVQAVEQGTLSETTIDRAVGRVLRMKIQSGLLDEPMVDAAVAPDAFGTDEQSELARRSARESIVLLKNNDDRLPLDANGLDSIAVVGPKADDAQELLGDYAYAAHYPEEEVSFDATTPLAAIRSRADTFDVAYEEGCTTTGPSTDGFDAVADAVSDADVALAFVGARSAVDFSEAEREKSSRPSVPTSGEGCDVTDLTLPGVQQELIERLEATETPLVVVLVSGRPHAIEWIDEHVSTVVHAWLPGEEGGSGIAEILFGDHNASGRLPVSLPRSVGQLPVHYNRKPNSMNEGYVYTDGSALYPFGHGLSYTEFEYSDLSVSSDELAPAGTLTASVTVTNTGDRAGHEVVQLYSAAQNPSQTRPVQELLGFERLSLDAGVAKRVTFVIDATQLAFYDREMNLTVEEGSYELRVGRSAETIVDTATVDVTDSKRVPATGPEHGRGRGRTYFTDTRTQIE